jgi:low affinity Fe/Cu permease
MTEQKRVQLRIDYEIYREERRKVFGIERETATNPHNVTHIVDDHIPDYGNVNSFDCEDQEVISIVFLIYFILFFVCSY